MQIQVPSEVQNVLYSLSKLVPDYEFRIIGGVVRDIIIGTNDYHDIDIATNATPQQLIAIFDKKKIKYIETGIAHGTITVFILDEIIEITTLRVDRETDGRHAEVEFTNDWMLDAQRRDFTINAMSIDYYGTLYDYFGGISDLKTKTLRFVGEADQRINEDYLRILRYFRFAAKLNWPITWDCDEVQACKRNWSGLKQVSGERIWKELKQIFQYENRFPILQLIFWINNDYPIDVIGLPYITSELCFNSKYDSKEAKKNYLYYMYSILFFSVNRQDEMTARLKDVHARLKFDGHTNKVFKYLIDNGSYNKKIPYTKKDALRFLVLGEPKDFLWHLALSMNLFDVADYILTVTIPKFPLSGDRVKALGFEGKEITKVMDNLKIKWIESNYQLTSAQLYDIIAK